MGACLIQIGLDPDSDPKSSAYKAATAVGLYDYYKKVEAANNIYNDQIKRFKGFADAEALLLDDAIILPYMSYGGGFAVTRIVPYSIPFAAYGTDEYKFKGMIVSDKVVTVAERDKIKAQWLLDRAAEYKRLNAKK